MEASVAKRKRPPGPWRRRARQPRPAAGVHITTTRGRRTPCEVGVHRTTDQVRVTGVPFLSSGLQARLCVRCEPGGEVAAFSRVADALVKLDPQAAGRTLATAWARRRRGVVVRLGKLTLQISVAKAARARVADHLERDAARVAAELAALANLAVVEARAGRAPRGEPAHRLELKRIKRPAAWIRALAEREFELAECERHPLVAAALREAAEFAQDRPTVCDYATAFLVRDRFAALWKLPDPRADEFDVASFRRRHIQPHLQKARQFVARRAELSELMRRVVWLRPLLFSALSEPGADQSGLSAGAS